MVQFIFFSFLNILKVNFFLNEIKNNTINIGKFNALAGIGTKYKRCKRDMIGKKNLCLKSLGKPNGDIV
jgi:hypothetical protein